MGMKNRIFTGFLGKPGMEWIFLDPAMENYLKLSTTLGEKYVF